ncbi:hypothetical protein ACFCWG_08520 [Streptomyces sp. NPDC056390]|uniref:hypothetical protein n=1 Tax=Streptomyces sp. NPDC056390 TaxID=3345806 RepID=UPI0035E2C851
MVEDLSTEDADEVAGDGAIGLRGQELAPGWAGPARGRIDAGCVQDFPGRRCGDRVSEPGRFTLDLAMTPSAVLLSEVQHELFDGCVCERPSWSAALLRVVPATGDQLVVP